MIRLHNDESEPKPYAPEEQEVDPRYFPYPPEGEEIVWPEKPDKDSDGDES